MDVWSNNLTKMSQTQRVVTDQLSLIRSQIKAKRFDETTFRLLACSLVSNDVHSFSEVRSSLIEFLRSEFLSVIRSISGKSIHEKLFTLEFFVHAFVVVGDVESCLALRYEALLMRQLKSASDKWLQVSYTEWLNFAEQALDSGFHSVAEKACKNALSCLPKYDNRKPATEECIANMKAVQKIKGLYHFATAFVAPNSVRVQATEYLERKTIQKHEMELSCNEKPCPASMSFKDGIKRHNMRKLHNYQRL